MQTSAAISSRSVRISRATAVVPGSMRWSRMPTTRGRDAWILDGSRPYPASHSRTHFSEQALACFCTQRRQFQGKPRPRHPGKLGSSDKNADGASIGRFGLGMKSLFHWCEAFFYLSSGDSSFSDAVESRKGSIKPDPGLSAPGFTRTSHAMWNGATSGPVTVSGSVLT